MLIVINGYDRRTIYSIHVKFVKIEMYPQYSIVASDCFKKLRDCVFL
ncbi:hypothetical protein CHELA20_53681 [Hyphomicrobiales bacterium]|nr:hypothetical protein CHELA41_21245 [Hyphomicrobiales bacterium]CAH1684736.1 hypothetical protein CHELA20_53681 [Hyphomicrobiales bacterium]